MAEADWDRLDRSVVTHRVVWKKEVLFRHGDPLTAIYAIRTGAFKLCAERLDGKEQIFGFRDDGGVLGMGALGDGAHVSDVVALENSVVCELPLESLFEMLRAVPHFQRRIHQAMSNELVRAQATIQLMGSARASEKVAGFLLDSRHCMRNECKPGPDDGLKMSRQEIANYIGLTIETLSRTLWQFEAQGFIEIHRRHVRIVDPTALQQLSNAGVRTSESPGELTGADATDDS